MGTLEEEELDYDENMDDLDLHPTGTLDDGDGLTVPTEEMAPKGRGKSYVHNAKPATYNYMLSLSLLHVLYACISAYTVALIITLPSVK